MSIAEILLSATVRDFLARHPDELAGGPPRPTPPGWYDGRRAVELTRVHIDVNLTAFYRTDRELYGVIDRWEPAAVGDCEDKALACHHRLAGLGWPKAAMRLWLCEARQGGAWRGHAVLVIRLGLSGGDVVDVALDCLRLTPTRRDDLGYRRWRMIDPDMFSQGAAPAR